MTAAEVREVAPLTGRAEELAFLEGLTVGPLPSVLFIHGIGGIGKSTLLEAFASRRRAGATVLRVDCRNVEPTVAGFFSELSTVAGGQIGACEQAMTRLAELGSVVLIFDDFDALRLLDSWLRRSFVPALPANVHVVFAARNPPIAAWLQMPWRGTFRSLELTSLEPSDAVSLLTKSGIGLAQAERINHIARGHPLTLAMAATTLPNLDDPALEDLAFHRIVEEFARSHLEEIEDSATRRAVEAASIVRRVTTPLLGALLPDVAPNDAYERLRSLALVRLSGDGLLLHDTVRDAIAAELRRSDPERYLAMRRAAWGYLTRELRTAPPTHIWRFTADLLYLLENPAVREAFFPSGLQVYALEGARPNDEASILAITELHDGVEAAKVMSRCWNNRPDDFYVARNRYGEVAGYYVMSPLRGSKLEFDHGDPVLANWERHLAEHPVQPGEIVLFLRRWLSLADGEAPSPVQAACWLDVKRSYMMHRPHLPRVYLTVRDAAPHAEAATQLGFSILDDCVATVGDASYVTAVLDFGLDSVDGWIASLVAEELGIASTCLLDVSARELVVGSSRAPLTRREFDTFYYMMKRAGDAIHRERLLRDVWGEEVEIGSNVVDVTIRSLRKKLAERADLIETVAGYGYRLRGDAVR